MTRNSKQFLRTCLTQLCLVLAVGAAAAAVQAVVSASDGVVTLPTAGATSAVVAGSIQNPTMYDIYVVSASTDVAGGVEFRDVQAGQLKPVKEFTVASFGSIDLKADGTHLLLMDLKRPLREGETVEVTIRTDGGIVLKLAATVRKP